MNKRLTPNWTPTLEEAFGPRGKLAADGEKFLKRALQSIGWKVTRFESHKKKQTSGIDLEIDPGDGIPIAVDVKTNLKTTTGEFAIEPWPGGWLFDAGKTNPIIMHINFETKMLAAYDKKLMQQYIASNMTTLKTYKKLHWMGKSNSPPFVKWVQITAI